MTQPKKILPTILICLTVVSLETGEAMMRNRYKSTCETIPSKIHITKDEFDTKGLLIRTCEEDAAINKCEGACASSLKPSAFKSNGFQKECRCCRESSYRQRQLTLSNCFDGDGQRLTGQLGSLKVTVNEPTDCRCHECGGKRNH